MHSKENPSRIFIAALLLIFSWTGPVLAQTDEYVEELRGVWITNVDSQILFEKENIAAGMDYLADRGFNVIYPVVWNKGYTLHPSDVAEEAFGIRQDPVFAAVNRDPLAEIIVEAHRVGIEVIPWFEYGFASIFGNPSGGHIIEANPHWASRDANGDIANKNGFYWMNALHPEVQQFMLDMIQEVSENYDIDGIQGDDRLPAMASEAGYSDFSKQLYRDEHDGNDPPAQFNQSDFLQWKADKLTTFAGELYSMVKNTDDRLIVSLSPSIYSFSLTEYLQDWPAWLDSSYVDIIHPQAYRYSISDYRQIIRNMLGQQPISSQGYIHRFFRPQIFPGILIKAGSRFNGPDYVMDAIEFNRSYDLKGEVFFFFEGLDGKNDFLGDSLRANKYQMSALPPHRNGKVRRPIPDILDASNSAGLEGTWLQTGTPDDIGNPTLQANAEDGNCLTFTMDVPRNAWYRIAVWNPVDGDATTSASFNLYGANETITTTVDQTDPVNRGWIVLGSLYLEAGSQQVITLDAAAAQDGKPSFANSAMLLLDRKNSPDVEIDAVITSAEPPVEQPVNFKLDQNFPNPFNPATTIQFSLPQSQQVTLEVFNSIGQRVALLANNRMFSAGTHKVQFNASSLASGLYLYRMKAGEMQTSRKMILLK